MFLEYSRCSVAGDDADRDPDHDDGTDAGDAQVHVEVVADVGDEVETRDSDSVYRSVSPSLCSPVCLPLNVHHLDVRRRIVILIATTVLMLATLRFMWMSMLMLVMKWRLTIVTLSIVLSVRLSVLRSVRL